MAFCNLTNCDPVKNYENQLIRPRRNPYTVGELGLNDFLLGDKMVHRKDIVVPNKKGHKLHGSLFHCPKDEQMDAVVIFLHGNGGCRTDALPLLDYLIPNSFALCCFDFSGSGMSEGDYVTLGYYERDDLEIMIGCIKLNFPKYKQIILWGKSMGAAIAIMYGSKISLATSTPNRVAGIVADSPYSNLDDVAKGMANKYSSYTPDCAVNTAVDHFRTKIKEKTGADISELNPKIAAAALKLPILIGMATADELTTPEKTDEIYAACAHNHPRNRLLKFPGDHFSPRTEDFYLPVIDFITGIIPRTNKPVPHQHAHPPPGFHNGPSLYFSTAMPPPMPVPAPFVHGGVHAGVHGGVHEDFYRSQTEYTPAPSLMSSVAQKAPMNRKEPLFQEKDPKTLFQSLAQAPPRSSLPKPATTKIDSKGLFYSMRPASLGNVPSEGEGKIEGISPMKTGVGTPLMMSTVSGKKGPVRKGSSRRIFE